MKEDNVYLTFTGKYIKRSQEYYIPSDAASLFIEHLNKNFVRILGIEGFDLTDKYTKPNIEIVADWSGLKDIQSSIEESRKFINKFKHKVSHFNFTLDI